MDKIPAAIFGASGMVGQRFVSMLQDHPQMELVAAYSSDRSKGKRIEEIWKLPEIPLKDEYATMKLERLDIEDAKSNGVKIVFGALPADYAKKVEGDASSAGIAVFSNASAYRMEKDVPILIPEVNFEHLDIVDRQRENRGIDGFIVTNANCSITGLAFALKPLVDRYSFKRVHVSTYQAISGAGYPGIPSLDINANCLPFISKEEEKMNREGRKILGEFKNGEIIARNLDIWANCVRVPSRDGHLEAVSILLDDENTTPEDVAKAFSEFRGKPQEFKLPSAPEKAIIVRRENDRPQPVLDAMAGFPARARGMAVSVGRIRVDGNILRFFCLVHNTIRGGAGDSVLNAECAIHEGKV